MQSAFSLRQLFSPRAGLVLGVVMLAAVFALAPLSVSAEASIGPYGVSLNPTGAQYPGTPYTVSGFVRNSSSDDYDGTVLYRWYYSPNAGQNWFDWSSLESFTGLDAKKNYNVSQSGAVGAPDGNTYSFRLCVSTSPNAGGGCSSAGSITATARPVPTYTLSLSKSGLGTITGSGISCGSDCSETYTEGTSVSLSASPDSGNGYAFSGWSGDCSGTGSCPLTMTSGKSVTANFIKVYNISASAGTGGTVSCPNCGSSVQSGTAVKATANANSGYEFGSWSEGSCSGSTSNVCAFTAGNSQTMTAHFTRISYTLSTSVSSGSGSVSGSGSYNSGSSIEVRATPSDGYEFAGWGGIYAGRSNPFTLTMESDKSVSASFNRSNYSLSVSTNGSGSVFCNGGSCASSYPSGTSVKITAEPSGDSVFGGWSGDCSGTASSCMVSMTQAQSVTALFAPLVSSGGGSPFVKEEHWGVFSTVRGPNRCDSPYLNGVCDKIVPVFTSPSADRNYTPGESFRVTGSSGFIKGYTNEVGLSLSYPGFSQSGIVQFGQYRPGSKTIDFDFGPFTMPSQPGTYRIQMTLSFLFGANGRLEWLSGYLPVTVAQPTREIIYPKATGSCETPGMITLSWSKADPAKWSGYLIYRFPNDPLIDPSGYQTITLRDINQTTYTDTTPKQNTRYWYVIETLTRTDLGVKDRASNVAAVLLAQASVSRGFTGSSAFGSTSGSDSSSAVSSSPCPLPNLTANAPTLSDQYGNSAAAGNAINVLGAGRITINGSVKNDGSVATPNGAFNNRFDYRIFGNKPWNLLQTVPLSETSTALGAGTSRAVKEHRWTGGVGTWEFQLFADSADAVSESNETVADNSSSVTKVEIVDYTPTLTPSSPTAFAGDTITFTADSALHGALKDKTKVSYGNFKCDVSGTPAPKTLTATSFSCTYSTAGTKTATVSASYYRIPKSATAPVTISPEPKPGQPSVSAVPSYCGGNIKLAYNNSASGATSYELWRQSSQTGSPWEKIETKDAATLLRALDHLTPNSAYAYRVVAKGAGGSTDSSVSTVTASPACTVSLLTRSAGSAAVGAKTISLAYNSPADLLWTTANPPPRSDCGLTSSSGSVLGSSLPSTGNKTTDSLTASQTFTINCKDPDFAKDPPWSDTASVRVFTYKPNVELYISPAGKPCMTLKQHTTTILKGNRTTLCWKVTAEEVTL